MASEHRPGSEEGPGAPALASARRRAADADVLAFLARFCTSQFALPAILTITLAVYATTLNDWFLADDFWFMRSAEHESFVDYAITSLDFREINALPDFNRYRPLYPIAWYAQHEVFGLTAWPYHVVLVGMHLACVWLVWLIARRLLKEMWTANLAALVFGLHPVYAEAVSWLSGGNRVFATLPFLPVFCSS